MPSRIKILSGKMNNKCIFNSISENLQNLFKAKHFDKSLFDANIQ